MKNKVYNKYVIRAILIVIAINMIDLLVTIYGINQGYFNEANPLQRYNFEHFGYLISFLFNIIFLGVIIPLVFQIGKFTSTVIDKKKYNEERIKSHYKIIVITICVMELIIILHNIALIIGVF